MKINEAISIIKSGTLNSVYFLKGSDQFLQSFFIENISEMFFKDEKSVKTLMLPGDMSGTEIINQLTIRDLFNTKKLFILKNPQQLKGKAAQDLIYYCKKAVESNILVMTMDDWMDKTTFSKNIEKIINPIDTRTPFKNSMKKWANYFFREEGKKVESKLIEIVVDMAGDSLTHLRNEIVKVCIWSGEMDIINSDNLIQFSGWQRERQRWEFLMAIGRRDLEESIFLGKIIITENETFISLLYPLTSLFQEMLFAKINRGTFHNYSGYIPISPSVRKLIPQFSRGYTKEKLVSVLAYLGDIDKRQKTAYTSDETELLQFIAYVIG